MRRRMYIGGVISKHRSSFGLQTPGYEGCIRDLKVRAYTLCSIQLGVLSLAGEQRSADLGRRVLPRCHSVRSTGEGDVRP